MVFELGLDHGLVSDPVHFLKVGFDALLVQISGKGLLAARNSSIRPCWETCVPQTRHFLPFFAEGDIFLRKNPTFFRDFEIFKTR